MYSHNCPLLFLNCFPQGHVTLSDLNSNSISAPCYETLDKSLTVPNLSFCTNKEREYLFCRTGRSFSEIIYGKYSVNCKIPTCRTSSLIQWLRLRASTARGTGSLVREQVTGDRSRCQVTSVQFSHSVMSDSLQPHGLQHNRPPCPSLIPEVYSNACPLSL